MQFKQYPSYKNSGVEWLGDVPEHWEVKKIKRISSVKRGASPRPINDLKYFDDKGEYAWVRISDVTRSNGFLFETEQRLSSLGASFSVKLEPESLFLSIAATVGKPCITKIKTCIHDGFVYFPNLNKHRDLLFNIFESKLCFVGLGKLGTQLNLNSETVEDIYVAIPPESEERAILGYIQDETTRIDNLIAKQEKLIELLEEQRKSIISHAVTKGLNPNAPMKDSGVEWLGEVPEHWDVAVVKRAFIVKLGKMLQPDQKDETDVIKKYLKASNLTWDGVKDIDNEMWFSKNELKKLKLEIGDLLVAEGGDVGKSCIFDSNEEFYYQNSVNRVRGQKNNANKFLYYWLFTLKYSGYIDILCNKSTIAHFTAEKLNETILLLPDSVEQNEIIAYLERENGKINKLILKQQSLIEKLKEYRASIISHAITGKIDVREFVA